MKDDLHRVLDELLAVEQRLGEAPADAFAERVQLRERMLELRADAAAISRATTAPGSLRRYLEQLELRRERIKRERLDRSWQDGGLGGMGIPDKQTEELNRRIEEAYDLPELEREIVRIRGKLAAGTAT